ALRTSKPISTGILTLYPSGVLAVGGQQMRARVFRSRPVVLWPQSQAPRINHRTVGDRNQSLGNRRSYPAHRSLGEAWFRVVGANPEITSHCIRPRSN